MANPDIHHEQLRQSRFLSGACAEIGRDRGDDLAFVFVDQRCDAVQTVAAHGERRIAFCGECGALRRK